MDNEARELSKRLDRTLPPHSPAIHSGDDDPLVMAAQKLAESPRPFLSESAQARIEARLREQALQIQHAQSPSRHQTRRSLIFAWRIALAVVVIVTLLSAGVVQASAKSLPGDVFYPVKRSIEDVRLAIVSTDSEPNLRLTLADRRVDEFERLLKDHTVYPHVLDEANDQMSRALDLTAKGYGSRAEIDRKVLSIIQRQNDLIEQAVPLATARQAERLVVVVDHTITLQNRVTTPDNPSPTVLPTSTDTAVPPATLSITPSALPAETAVPTQTIPAATETPRPTDTVDPSTTPRYPEMVIDEQTITPAANAPVVSPTRTPPGHGPTPGLGNNPPGHGGQNPGNGNNGNPPGQNKPPKDKK